MSERRAKDLKGTIEFDTPAFTGSFYFNVDDVATLWAQLKDVVEIAYGRPARVSDVVPSLGRYSWRSPSPSTYSS